MQKLLEAFSDTRYYTFILFLCRTGCRTSEAAGLKWGALDLTRRKAAITGGIVRGKLTDETKSGKDREVDFTPMLVAELKKHKEKFKDKGKWVFQNTQGGHLDLGNFRARAWYPTLESAELKKVRIHDLRHSYASLLISRTKDLHYAQKQLGHHSIQVTVDRYGHLLDEDASARLVDALDG